MFIGRLAKYITTQIAFALFLSCIPLWLPASAQIFEKRQRIVGSHLYDKLLKRQNMYKEAMLSGDSLSVAEAVYQLGKSYIGIGDYLQAKRCFIRSLRIREPLGPSEQIGKVYLRMAEYHTQRQQYREAYQYAQKGKMNFSAVGSLQGTMNASTVCAGVHFLGFELNKDNPGSAPSYSLDSALYYLKKAELISLSLRVPYDIANIYYCKGALLLKVDFKQGMSYLEKAYKIFLAERSAYPVINTSISLGKAYLTMGKPSTAKIWLDRAQFVSDTANYGDYQQKLDLYYQYTKLYEQTGNLKKTMAFFNKYHQLYVEASNADREGAITLAGIDYETKKTAAHLKAQQKELALRTHSLDTQRRLASMTIALGLIAFAAGVIFFWLFRKYKKISKQNAALVMEQNHRVKNNLQEITNLLSLQSSRLVDENAKKALMEGLLRIEAMALVHQRLYDGDRLVEINLCEFIPELVNGVLRSYDYDMLLPVYNLDRIWLHVDKAIPLGLIINELVTNSCKYAFPVSAHPVLNITCNLVGPKIKLAVSDNGPGFDLNLKRKTFGLQLIKLFAERLEGRASFQDNGNSFSLEFRIKNQSLATKNADISAVQV